MGALSNVTECDEQGKDAEDTEREILEMERAVLRYLETVDAPPVGVAAVAQ